MIYPNKEGQLKDEEHDNVTEVLQSVCLLNCTCIPALQVFCFIIVNPSVTLDTDQKQTNKQKASKLHQLGKGTRYIGTAMAYWQLGEGPDSETKTMQNMLIRDCYYTLICSKHGNNFLSKWRTTNNTPTRRISV